MNKKIGKILLLGFLTLLALPVSAATLNTAPTNVNVKQGQSFNVVVSVDPQGRKSYTVKLELKFPADLLEVKSFNFGDNYSWVAVSQLGYDSLDNASGLLVKTAGYPKGFSAPTSFGTVSFVAKKSGSGVIEVGPNSMVLDSGSVNTLTGALAKTTVSVATLTASLPAGATATPKATVLGQKTGTGELSPTPSPAISVGSEGQAGEAATHSLFATILTLGTNKTWLGVLVVVVVLALVAYIATRSVRRRKGRVE